MTYQIKLQFGRNIGRYDEVSNDEWQTFVIDHIVPRFDAFTLITANGYWKGQIEDSETFQVYVDWADLNESVDKAHQIARLYCQLFHQDAVLYDLTCSHAVSLIGKRDDQEQYDRLTDY